MSVNQNKPLYEVTCTTKNNKAVLLTVKGNVRQFNSKSNSWITVGSWGPYSVSKIFNDINTGDQYYVCETGTYDLVPVQAVKGNPHYIRSQANSSGIDNLDALPICG